MNNYHRAVQGAKTELQLGLIVAIIVLIVMNSQLLIDATRTQISEPIPK